MAKWYEKGPSGWITGLTDMIGLTDSHAPGRAASAAQSGMDAANSQFDTDMAPQLTQLWEAAMDGRGLGENLDRFDKTMQGAMAGTMATGNRALGEMDAGNSGNVQSYLNPKMDEMLRGTSQAMQGNAGSALQSSATNKNIADAVGRQAGQMWDTAFSQALGDSSHNLQANQQYGQSMNQMAGMGEAQLAADNDPIMSWINLNNDRAMQRYAGNTGITQANVQAAGTPNTFI